MSLVKRSMVAVMALMMIFSAVSVVGAQGPDSGNRPDGDRVRAVVRLNQIVLETAAEALGVEPLELWQNVEPGTTLAEVISVNGGDVDQIMADATVAATEAINTALAEERITQAEADRMLENLDNSIERVINFPRPTPGDRLVTEVLLDGALLRQITASMDVPAQEVIDARQSGQSLASYVSENGGNVDQIVADTVVAVTERIEQAVENDRISQEVADELLANLESRLIEALNSTDPLPNIGNRPDGRGNNDGNNRPNLNFGFEDAIAESLGITPREFVQELRSGKTPNEIISENGGDPNAIIGILIANATERIETGVENGLISQDQADNLIENLETIVENFMNSTREDRPERGGRGFNSDGADEGILE